jgi:hypothetical protein
MSKKLARLDVYHLIIFDWHQHKDATILVVPDCKEKHHHPVLREKNHIENKKKNG